MYNMEGWKEVTLGSICIVKKGEQYNKLNLENQGDYPCINGGISPSGYTDKWNTDKNTITISEGGNSCGYINLIPTKFWSGGHCYSILEIKEHLNYEFLYHALKSREKRIMDLRVGSGIPNIQQKAIKTFKIKFPESIPEQQKIAEILSSIDTAIGETEALIAKYERIKTGLMQDLLTKGIDANGNIRNENTHEFKDSPLGRVPVEWEVGKMKKWISVKGGFAFQSKDFTNSGIQLLRIGNLFNNQLDLLRSPIFLPSKMIEKTPDFIVKNGDIVMSMTGTYGKRDYGFAISIENGLFFLNQRLCKFIYDKNIIENTFLLCLLRSEYYLDELFKSVTGSKQGNLKNSNILDIYIALPNIEEQQKINQEISNIEDLLQKEKINLSKQKSLKTALMQDLLTGKVRVNNLLEA